MRETQETILDGMALFHMQSVAELGFVQSGHKDIYEGLMKGFSSEERRAIEARQFCFVVAALRGAFGYFTGMDDGIGPLTLSDTSGEYATVSEVVEASKREAYAND